MTRFSGSKKIEAHIGELIIEDILSLRVDSIKHLNLSDNESWFYHDWVGRPKEEQSSNIDLLAQLF